MKKKYTIEIPLYASPVERVIEIDRSGHIAIVAYAGFPDSPLNGGRNNFMLDWLSLRHRFSLGITKGQLEQAITSFYRTVARLNQNKIPFRLAFTNMFVSPQELCPENLYPVEWLVRAANQSGIRNGVMINNGLLEDAIRRQYGDALDYVSSCTKYVSPDKILTPQETLGMYERDAGAYDFVCLTPQDSRRQELLRTVSSFPRHNIIAICNSYCADACNSYHHYAFMSRENKRSLLRIGLVDLRILTKGLLFLGRKAPHCSALRQCFTRMPIEALARMQLEAGITNFKLGRGFGDDSIERLVKCITDFENGRG